MGKGHQDDIMKCFREIKGNIIFIWGRQDPHLPFAGRRLICETLEKNGVQYEWHEFNAQHAFLRDEGLRYDAALVSNLYEAR